MTNPNSREPVAVVQADREAAAELSGGWWRNLIPEETAKLFRDGLLDNNPLVQAFARYRQRAIEEPVQHDDDRLAHSTPLGMSGREIEEFGGLIMKGGPDRVKLPSGTYLEGEGATAYIDLFRVTFAALQRAEAALRSQSALLDDAHHVIIASNIYIECAQAYISATEQFLIVTHEGEPCGLEATADVRPHKAAWKRFVKARDAFAALTLPKEI